MTLKLAFYLQSIRSLNSLLPQLLVSDPTGLGEDHY